MAVARAAAAAAGSGSRARRAAARAGARAGAAPTAAPAPPPPAPKEFQPNDNVKPIFFDFDKAVIRPGDAKTLDASAAWLKQNAQPAAADRGTLLTSAAPTSTTWRSAIAAPRPR